MQQNAGATTFTVSELARESQLGVELPPHPPVTPTPRLQSVAGYLGPALVFGWGGALRERFNCYLRDFFASISKVFIVAAGEGGWLGAGLSLYGV